MPRQGRQVRRRRVRSTHVPHAVRAPPARGGAPKHPPHRRGARSRARVDSSGSMNAQPTRLEGTVVIVSGSAGGQGAAEVALLAAQGARVVVADIDDVAGAGVADDIGESAIYHHLDVRSEDDWRATLAAAID